MSKKRALITIAVGVAHYLIYSVGILILWVTPNNKYEWMQEMDNTIKNLPENSSGSAGIGMAILALVLVVMQAVRFKFAKSRLERNIVIVLALLAVTVWAVMHS